MNELLSTMSTDMHIIRFRNETDESFAYRLCYSALGLWCLYTARNISNNVLGTTKHNQTIVMNNLIERYATLFPTLTDKFIDVNNQQCSFSVSIRRVYEETGYLLTDEDNHNAIANYGRCLKLYSNYLFFGLPSTRCEVNGFGIYSKSTEYIIEVNDFLIRDRLTSREYYNTCFDIVDFYEKDIEITELEFFNPKLDKAPSKSWQREPETDCTIARATELGPYYRIMRYNDAYLFADEPIIQQDDSFTSYEYRRLYFALKQHYGSPLTATVTKIDEIYSRLQIKGHLPNREYYLLLLMSWPERNAFDKINYIIENTLLPSAVGILENLGIRTMEA